MYSVAASCGESVLKLQLPQECSIDSILSIPIVSKCVPIRKEVNLVRFCSSGKFVFYMFYLCAYVRILE